MTDQPHFCLDCGIQLFKSYNSMIWAKYCLKCANKMKKSKIASAKKINGLKAVKKSQKKDNIDKLLDDAWSLVVKIRAGFKCEYCGNTKSMNSHHIFSRAKKSVRWNVDNGICLDVNHHIGSGFSAHKTSCDFTLWLIKYRGEKAISELSRKANSTSHYSRFEKEIILKELQKEINEYHEKSN